jgi:hypothetical protein
VRNAKAAVLLIAILSGLACGQQSTVAGITLDSVTRQPLAGVHISLRPPTERGDEQPASVWGAISKQDGSFSMAQVPAGSYDLVAKHNGYMQLVSVPLQGGAEQFPSPSPLTVKAGQNVTDVRIEMTAEASITGHVFDENGDPLQHFVIQAESVRDVPVGPTPAQTDERGQFRLVLWPGKFHLKATSWQFLATLSNAEGNGADAAYLTTYYPAAETRASAGVIQVAPGQQTTDIDFHLTPARTLRISGRVSGMPEAGKEAMVFLLERDGRRSTFRTGPDGKFTFGGLVPAQYRLLAVYAAEPKRMQSQVAEVRLESGNETGIVLALALGETLSGIVEIAGGSVKSAGLDKLNVQLPRVESISGGELLSGLVDPEGRFRIGDVFPGRFEIRVLPLPETAYLKSIRVDNSDVSDGIIDFSRGVNQANLRITISLAGATLEGRVVGSDGKANSNRCLVFLGTTPDKIDEHFKSSGPDGVFRFTGLRPGKYRLIAIDPRLAMAGSETLKQLFDAAPEFEIHERDRIRRDAEIALPRTGNAKP